MVNPQGFQGPARMSLTMGRRWQLEAPLVYDSSLRDDPARYTVPGGYKTSFSSVPPALRWIVLPTEKGPRRATASAVLHSWLVKESGEGPKECRAVFRESLAASAVPWWQRFLLRIVG